MLIFIKKLDPLIHVWIGIFIILIPITFIFIHKSNDVYAQDRYANSDLPPIPNEDNLLELINRKRPNISQIKIEKLYQAKPIPRSGLVCYYKINSQDTLYSNLAVLRHDISCSTCNDLLVCVIIDTKGGIEDVIPIEPWEIENKPLDPLLLLSQLRGKSLRNHSGLDNVDGITSATYTSKALLAELRVLRQWMIYNGDSDSKESENVRAK